MKSFNALTSTHPDSRRRSRCRGSVSRPSSPLRNRDISGCLICRLRKKRCSLGSEGKNNGSCSECSKFHIECFGAGLSRPPIDKEPVLNTISLWIKEKKWKSDRQSPRLQLPAVLQSLEPPIAQLVEQFPTIFNHTNQLSVPVASYDASSTDDEKDNEERKYPGYFAVQEPIDEPTFTQGPKIDVRLYEDGFPCNPHFAPTHNPLELMQDSRQPHEVDPNCHLGLTTSIQTHSAWDTGEAFMLPKTHDELQTSWPLFDGVLGLKSEPYSDVKLWVPPYGHEPQSPASSYTPSDSCPPYPSSPVSADPNLIPSSPPPFYSPTGSWY